MAITGVADFWDQWELTVGVSDFHGFIGHREVVQFIEQLADGALCRAEPLPHLLLGGVSGVGKSRLARSIAAKMGTGYHIILGKPEVTPIKVGIAARQWEACDVVFLDELHALRPRVQETFYRVMVEHKAPKVVEKGRRRGLVVDGEVDIPAVTVIGATDQPGQLLPALHKRFAKTFILTRYPLTDMVAIARHVASQNGLLLTAQAVKAVAKRCQGIPRDVEHFVRGLCLFYPERACRADLSVGHVRKFFKACGIDELGRSKEQQEYMNLLKDRSSKSLRRLHIALEVDKKFAGSQIEAWLIVKGWVTVDRDGRRLTSEGLRIVNDDKKGATHDNA